MSGGALNPESGADSLFVGRDEALHRLRALVDPRGPRVAWVHGLGGIGKTSLIRAFLSEHPETTFASYDAQALPNDLDRLAAEASAGGVVVDGLDQAPGCAELLRRVVLPKLGAGSLLLGSREPPDLRWSADLGPEGLLDVPVEGLDTESSLALLARWGVDGAAHPELLELCHGHPLMLVLAAQLHDVDAFVEEGLDGAPELVVALVEALGAVPRDLDLVDAITVCGIARRTTEPLLRAALGRDDARALFDALRTRSWSQFDRDGLYPHDLVRDAIRAEAKWRARADYDRLFRAVADEAIARVRTHGVAALPDVMFLLADNAFYRRYAAHRHGVVPGPRVQTADIAQAEAMLRPHTGETALKHMAHWRGAGMLQTFFVHGPDGEPSEVFALLDDRVLFGDDPVDDPVVRAARELLHGLGPRPGSRVLFCRGVAHRDHGLASPLGNARVMVTSLAMGLEMDSLIAVGAVLHPAEVWRPMLERDASLSVWREVQEGDRTHIVHFHDLRLVDIAGWIEAQLFPPPAHAVPHLETLDRDEFDLAVRQVLRALARPGSRALHDCRLASTPLVLRTAHDPSPESRETALRELVIEAIDRSESARRRAVLWNTYVEPASKQYAAAADLGLSFATYRRELARGVAEITEALWQQEVAGG